MIDIICDNGGDIIHFSGDAISYILYKNYSNDYVQRALYITKCISDYINENNKVYLEDRAIEINVHCSVKAGNIQREIVHTDDNSVFLFRGKTINESASLLDSIKKEIILDDYTAKLAGHTCTCKNTAAGLILEQIEKPEKHRKRSYKNSAPEKFINKQLLEYLCEENIDTSLLNMHRDITVCFISLDAAADKHTLTYILNLATQYSGYFDKFDFYTDGLKLMLLFGAVGSVGRHEENALRFTDALRQHLENTNIRFKTVLHSGIVFSGIVGNETRKEYTVMGDPVNTAARILGKCPLNTVAVSSEFHKRTSILISYKPIGKYRFKGKSDTIELYSPNGDIKSGIALYWTDPAKFIGREKELEMIRNRLTALSDDIKEMINIQGKSGSGKSLLIGKLISEFEDNYPILLIKCNHFSRNIPFSGIRQILSQINAAPEGDLLIEELRKTIRKSDAVVIRRILFSPKPEYSEDELGIMTRILSEQIAAYYSDFPLIMIIDDSQWLDRESSEMLKNAFFTTSRRNIALICSSDEMPSADITLDNFNKKEVGTYIEKMYKSKEAARVLKDKVYSVTQGHPLFVSEMLAYLENTGCIEHKDNKYVLHLSNAHFDVSAGLESFVNRKLDILPYGVKKLLRVIAVFQDTINEKELSILTGIPVNEKELIKTNLIEISSTGFVFRNSVIRDSIYNSIPFSDKTDMHMHIIHLCRKSIINKSKEFKARHLELARMYKQALPLCIELAEQYKAGFMLSTALEYYNRSLDMLDKIPKSDLNEIHSSLLPLFRKEI